MSPATLTPTGCRPSIYSQKIMMSSTSEVLFGSKERLCRRPGWRALALVRTVDGVVDARPVLWTDNLLRPATAPRHHQATLGQPGYVNIHANIGADADLETVRASLQRVLPEDMDVLSQAEARARLRDQVGPYARGFRGGLLGFSGLATLVAAVMIYNTFLRGWRPWKTISSPTAVPTRTLVQDVVEQPHRTIKPGTETPHRRRPNLPQPSVGDPTRRSASRRNQRRNYRHQPPLHRSRNYPTTPTPNQPATLPTSS